MIKLANIKPPKIEPLLPQILCLYLLRHANSKLIKIKLFAANVFIKDMFQVLNLQCLFNFYNGYQTSSCQYIKVVPFLGCDLNSGLTPHRALSSLGSCPSHVYHSGANVTVFLWLLFFR